MSLRPMLFVGIGGTGGKVLGALRHYTLRALHSNGVSTMPSAWQYVHIDVPVVRDADEEGMPFSLPADSYCGLMEGGSAYRNEYRALQARFNSESDSVKYQALESWAPAPADQVPGDIALGAGQYRGLGRLALLSRLRRAHAALAAAKQETVSQSNLRDLALLSQDLGLGAARIPASPLVVIVGSLCGGSGSGMMTDISDVLRGLGLKPTLALAFLPEVFKGTPAENDHGLAPNTYLALNELLSSAMGTDARDMPTSRYWQFRVAGVPTPPTTIGGPELLALVGRSNGAQELDSGVDVYRATGRMLSALTLDPELQKQFDAYVTTNVAAGGAAGATQDHLGLRIPHDGGAGRARLFGLGFSNLSVGRDFFAEYARYRLLRQACEQLLDAHLRDVDDNDYRTADQVLHDAVEHSLDSFLDELKLNEYGLDRDTLQSHDDILRAIAVSHTQQGKSLIADFSSAVQNALVRLAKPGLFHRTIDVLEAGGVAAGLVTDAVAPTSRTSSVRPLAQEATQLVRTRLESYVHELQQSMLSVIPASVGDRGLPVTMELLKRVVEQLDSAVKELEEDAVSKVQRSQKIIGDLQAGMGLGRRSFKDSDHASLHQFAGSAAEALLRRIEADELYTTAALAREITSGLLTPWRLALADARRSLEESVRPANQQVKPIDVWPSAHGVPDHYRPSPVEIVLDDVDDFPRQLAHLVTQRIATEQPDEADVERVQKECMERAVVEILVGQGQRIEGPKPVATYQRQWVTSVAAVGQARPAAVATQFGWQQLLDRVDAWTSYPNSATQEYIEMSLAGYLSMGNQANANAERDARRRRLLSAFESWSQAARPLITYNNDLLSAVHGVPTAQSHPVLGEMNIPASMQDLRDELTGRLHGAWGQQAQLKFTDHPSDEAGAFSFSSPFHAVACASVMAPIANQHDPDWQYRRARPLPESIPLAPEARRALVLGWFAGRLLGRARLQMHGGAATAEVRVADRWVRIDLEGLRPVRGRYAYDAPGRIVEAVLPALINAYRAGSLEALAAFRELIELGHDSWPFRTTEQQRMAGHFTPLSLWVQDGAELANSGDTTLLTSATTPQERVQSVQESVEKLRSSVNEMSRIASQEEGDAERHAWVSQEIIDDIHAALDALQQSAQDTTTQIDP